MAVKDIIKQKLSEGLQPVFLEVRDDSHLHVGHVGNPDGKGETHFHVTITSEAFQGMSKVNQQRAVYAVLEGLMPAPIHALSLTTHAPSTE